MTITSTRRHSSGFTLIELMIVIVIAAILLAVAVPSFDDLITRNSVESLQTKVSSAVATARTEAASRNTPVAVCATKTGTDCDGAGTATDNNWPTGWIVFEDPNQDGDFDKDNEEPIDVYLYEGAYTFRVQNQGGNVNSFSFTPQGFLRAATNVLIRVCEPDKRPRYARALYVNASGLVMKSRDGNGDGTHEDPRFNMNMTCG